MWLGGTETRIWINVTGFVCKIRVHSSSFQKGVEPRKFLSIYIYIYILISTDVVVLDQVGECSNIT